MPPATQQRATSPKVRFRAAEIQSAEKILADLRAEGPTDPAASRAAKKSSDELKKLPEVQKKLAEMMAAQWEGWVDKPIPMLGNRAPREAVKDPDGREIVGSIIIEAERNENMPTDPAVFRRLRERLGLARDR